MYSQKHISVFVNFIFSAMLLLSLFIAAFLCYSFVSASRILVVTPIAPRSSSHFANSIGQVLYERGHYVKIINPFPPPKSAKGGPDIVNISSIPKMLSEWAEFAFDARNHNKITAAFEVYPDALRLCEVVFQDKEFQNVLLNKNGEHFDLVILSGVYQECFYGVPYAYKAPYVIASCMGMSQMMSDATGIPDLPSSIPHTISSFGDRMTFFERLHNTFITMAMKVFYTFWYFPAVDKLNRVHFGDNVPSLSSIQQNASLVLINSDSDISFPRPLPPNVIQIGCLHCKKAQQLPKDLKDYVESSGPAGFIFFSLGSLAQSDLMPKKYKELFLESFSKLPLKVIWKYEADSTSDISIPPNLKLGKWFPQQDLLGHPKCRLFITHGGLLSTQEAMYHGVPMAGMPLFIDQFRNVKLIEMAGLGLELHLETLTVDGLVKTIFELVQDKRFSENARRKSSLMHDRLSSVQNVTSFWLEYVIRHKGAHHLKLASSQLNIAQYFCLDVFAFIVLIVGVFIYLDVKLIRLICKGRIQKNKKE